MDSVKVTRERGGLQDHGKKNEWKTKGYGNTMDTTIGKLDTRMDERTIVGSEIRSLMRKNK